MSEIRKIQRMGSSIFVNIPKSIQEQFKLEVSTHVQVSIDGQTIRIKPIGV